MRFICIIFDFDGVIAETDNSRIELLANALRARGIDTSNLFSHSPRGLSTKAFLKKTYPTLSCEKIKLIIDERHDLFFGDLEKHCIVYPGAKQTIAKLARDFDLQLATINSQRNTDKLIKFTGLKPYFSKVHTSESIENENYLKDYSLIVQAIGHDVTKTIVIEDSVIGLASAKLAGFNCMGFDPHGSRNFGKMADYTASDFQQIHDFFYAV